MIAPTPHSHTYQLTAQRVEQLGGLDAAINKCADRYTDVLHRAVGTLPDHLDYPAHTDETLVGTSITITCTLNLTPTQLANLPRQNDPIWDEHWV